MSSEDTQRLLRLGSTAGEQTGSHKNAPFEAQILQCLPPGLTEGNKPLMDALLSDIEYDSVRMESCSVPVEYVHQNEFIQLVGIRREAIRDYQEKQLKFAQRELDGIESVFKRSRYLHETVLPLQADLRAPVRLSAQQIMQTASELNKSLAFAPWLHRSDRARESETAFFFHAERVLFAFAEVRFASDISDENSLFPQKLYLLGYMIPTDPEISAQIANQIESVNRAWLFALNRMYAREYHVSRRESFGDAARRYGDVEIEINSIMPADLRSRDLSAIDLLDAELGALIEVDEAKDRVGFTPTIGKQARTLLIMARNFINRGMQPAMLSEARKLHA